MYEGGRRLLALARAAATAFAAVLTEAGRDAAFLLAGAACFFAVALDFAPDRCAVALDFAAGRCVAALDLAAGRAAALTFERPFWVVARALVLETLATFAGLRAAAFLAVLGLAADLRTIFAPFLAGLLFRFVTTGAFLMLSLRTLDPFGLRLGEPDQARRNIPTKPTPAN